MLPLYQGAESLSVHDFAGNRLAVIAVLIDEGSDTALLKLAVPVKVTPLMPVDFSKVQTGEDVFAIGNPLGLLPDTISQGIVSSKRRIGGVPMVQITAAVSHGNLGGPVFTAKGRVAGIVDASLEGGQSLNLATSVDCAKWAEKARPVAASSLIAANSHAKSDSIALRARKSLDELMRPRYVAWWTTQARFEFVILDAVFGDNHDQTSRSFAIEEAGANLRIAAEALCGSDVRKASELAFPSSEYLSRLGPAVEAYRQAVVTYTDDGVRLSGEFGHGGDAFGAAKTRADQDASQLMDCSYNIETCISSIPGHDDWEYLTALPPPVAAFNWAKRSMTVCPDLERPSSCTVRFAIGTANLEEGDEIIGLKQPQDSDFASVKTWMDLVNIFVDFKGEHVDVILHCVEGARSSLSR